jgi:putative acetyltransferase
MERPGDQESVFEVDRQAFETPAEAELVAALRGNVVPMISLVAVMRGKVVGHVLLTPAIVGGDEERAMALGPVAVLPEHQNQGIGSRLVRAGLEACRNLGRDAVFVLGHAEYYPRFGFCPAAQHGFRYRGAALDRYFMVAPLRSRALEGLSGDVRFHPEFDRT